MAVMAAGFWLAGTCIEQGEHGVVRHPGSGALIAEYVIPRPEHVQEAITAAAAAARPCRELSAAERAAALDHVVDELGARFDEAAELIEAENGKPAFWARAEVTRAVSTFRWAAEEARRFGGEVQRLDTDAAASGRAAIIRRFPLGPVLGVAPFNFPLNLVAHKVAPAIAVGAPVIVKPSPRTPLSALLLGEILSETDLPAGAVSVLPVDVDQTLTLVDDPRVPIVSFTGSDVVGFDLAARVPRKKVVLELGGDAAAIVCADYTSDEDLAWAAQRVATFAMYQAGQSCISVQRLLIADDVAHRLIPMVVSAVEALGGGSSEEPGELVGPVIDDASAQRITEWIDEAVRAGAELLCGGSREGTYVAPTVLRDVPADVHLGHNEAFAPVLCVRTFSSLDEAFDTVNDSRFGLQCGVFTHDIQTAFRAHRDLEVGGVIVGDVPSFRADQMPYGGVKDSGNGREGIRSAMRDFTEDRVLVLTSLDL